MHPFLLLLIGMAVVIGGILWLRLHAFLALLLGALVVAVLTPHDVLLQYALAKKMSAAASQQLAGQLFVDRVAEGFGKTVGQIGIVIAMASIIGECMLRSGAADRIVRAALKLLGEKRAPQAFLSSGYLLGIPVFFDTVFYLMVPLVKATRLRTGKNYLLYVLTVVAGATMTHSLVPPTPGPLFVANQFNVNLATMIVAGCIVGAVTATSGYLYAVWANRRMEVPLRESEESLKHLEAVAAREDKDLPALWVSLLPIVLPVVLITLNASLTGAQQGWMKALVLMGDKNISLILGAVIALFVLWRSGSSKQGEESVKAALADAGVIILITSAGGAFGTVLQQTNIGAFIERMATGYQAAILPMAFVLTALIRTAQGSATVAMLTAAGAFSGIATAQQLGFHPVYLALVIGCGSKLVMWMNDSGFWVITKMSGMTEKEGLKALVPMNVIMGVLGLLVTMLGAKLFPLI
ncbi:MAG TPA: GntP family permease [Blastocatellia bacterium]|nr:GntP family permease [Blastocatellia bacterium]HMV83010.1 GntP family permease [Blastocatellia bacterium]HMX28548.1 GntP family permease [Blastocatellia bacterium]HMY74909.1 GntP family permease [Blastocatellia bacterium]HMZ19741.1 GntP family permease [Blastocatellia bacterium]